MSDQKDIQTIAKAKGRPMLTWVGKKPLDKVEYFPAQEKEAYGDLSAKEFNELFWGDNLQVLSHMLREYRDKVDLIYIDPPFDSKADYVRKVKLRGEVVEGDQPSLLEEKQYTDIWENDEYLQFMYERLLVLRELMSDKSSIYIHCDWHKDSYLRIMMDEIFGADNFMNEITWQRDSAAKGAKKSSNQWSRETDVIIVYKKMKGATYNVVYKKELGDTQLREYMYKDPDGRKFKKVTLGDYSEDSIQSFREQNLIYKTSSGREYKKYYLDEAQYAIGSLWNDIVNLSKGQKEQLNYPTQKPEALLERIIQASSNPGDLILDCFCGSGTTMAVAQKLGRRWIGCDINIGAIQTTTKRLSQILQDQQSSQQELTDGDSTGLNAFKVLNVNNYDIFKNELEAKDIVMDVYGVDPIKQSYFDGMLDNNFVKVLPLNRVLNKHDITLLLKNINDSIDGFTVKPTTATGEHLYEEGVVVICSGVELDADDYLKKQNGTGVPISIKNILRDKKNLVFKQKPEAEIKLNVDGKKLIIEIVDFYSPILMRRLELENKKVIDSTSQAKVEDFHQIIDSVAIDIDYNGDLFNAEIMDLPDRKSVITAKYKYEYDSKGKKKIAIKIVDVLGEEYFESFEVEVGV